MNRAKAVIFYRVPAHPAIIHAILYARALGIQTIYEIDDLIFDSEYYPDPYDSFEGQITPETYAELQRGVPLFRHAMKLCDVGLASTPALAEAVRTLVLTNTCHVLRNGLDDRNAPYLVTPSIPLTRGHVTIFYGSGTKAHNQDFTELAAPALLFALERHAHVRLIIAGHLALDARFDALAERVHRLDFSNDLEAYWEVLSGIDINLAVLTESATTDAKSEIKWLEAAVCSVPSIVSDTRTYREILVDGEDALLARTPEAWRTALERLIADPRLRRSIGRRAREKALTQYSPDVAVRTLASFLPTPIAKAGCGTSEARDGKLHAMRTLPGSTIYPFESMRTWIGPDKSKDHALAGRYDAKRGASGAMAPRRPRILLVNVYFPPQTIGGATRVMRDNVDYMINQGGIDLAIVTTDVGVETPYRTRIDAYRGVPVYRIAVRRMAHMDWTPFDPEILHPFEELLDRFDPDLVHFHCIQQLTATVVEAVRRRGTPYVVTLHDAWWISDFQFLIDADHKIQHARPDPVTSGSDTRLGLTRSIARRRRLGRLLDGAHARLAVSEAFAAIYREAGVSNVQTVANGVSTLRPVPRPLRPSARVRLGHIGNRSAHKGACLLEIVLRTTRFDNLDLTIIEHGRDAGYSREEVWVTTPVRIIGPVAQTDISQLYAILDVLLAPSIWPESYGLVTREAKASGLWVIASNLGAIGEDINEGVDGFRIDVSSPEGLRSALRRVDAAPELYGASPPPPERPFRSSDDQGADLLNIYRELHLEVA